MTGTVVEMTVTDAPESLASVHSLLTHGREVHFQQDSCYLVTRFGESIPLELHGKRWYLKVRHLGDKQCGSHHWQSRVSPVTKGVRFEELKEPDVWRTETKDDDEHLVRQHNTARFQKFAPDKVQNLPVELGQICPGRLTKMIATKDGGRTDEEDAWTSKRLANRNVGFEGLGETWFRLRRSEEPSSSRDNAHNEDIADMERTMEDILAGKTIVEDDVEYEPSIPGEDKRETKEANEVAVPAQPTAKQRDNHMLHHANFDPWCETCVMGQGREKRHERRKEDTREHLVYSDYMFFSRDGNVEDVEEGKKQKGLITVLTAICTEQPVAIFLGGSKQRRR